MMMHNRRRILAATLGAVLTAGLSACGSSAEPQTGGEDPGGRTALTVAVATVTPTLGQSYYTSVPTLLGYWKDAGLDIELKRLEGSGEVVTSLATKRIDIGHAGNYSNMAAHVNGGAKTKAFMHDIPGNPYFPVVMNNSPVKSLKDLQGKTLGIFSLSSDANDMLAGVMKQQGIDSSSINIVATGNGPTAVEALRSGKIDGWMAYDSGAALIRSLGIDWRAIDQELFEDFAPGSGVMATPETIKDKREAVVKYGQGLAKGMIFAKTNPEAAVLIHWKAYPETKPAGKSDEEAMKSALIELKERLDNVFETEGLWGNTTEEKFREYIDVFRAAGGLKRDVEVSEIWDNSMMKDINDFDAAEIEEQAKNFKIEDL